MSQKENSIHQSITKLRETAKEERKQIEILKAFLKQMRSIYNEELEKYNMIASDIIQQELLYEKQCKRIIKTQNQLTTILLKINDDFIKCLKDNIKTIKPEINKVLLLCIGYPADIESSIQIPISTISLLIEMLKYTEVILEDYATKDNKAFQYLKQEIEVLKSNNKTMGHPINQVITYISLIIEKIMCSNDKAALLVKLDLLSKSKDEYYICLKDKEKEINVKYSLYKIKCNYIKKVNDLFKEYKEYELLGNHYSKYNELNTNVNALLHTKVDSFDTNNALSLNNNLCLQSKYDDNLSEGLSCSYINDISINGVSFDIKQDNRALNKATEVITLSPLGDKDDMNYFYNSNMNKKTKNFFNKEVNNNEANNTNSLQQDKTSSGYNAEHSDHNIGEGMISNSIQDISSNYKSKSDIQILRGKQNKNANYSLKLEQPVNSGGCCVSCT